MSPHIQAILKAIAITEATVKVLIGDAVQHLHPVDAAALVRRYRTDEWTVKLRKCGSVKWIRRANSGACPPWVECYRTAEAPVLQPSIEWLRSRRGLA